MYPDLSPASKALRAELRKYFATIITPQDREELRHQDEGGPTFERILRRMGSDGWLGLGWPQEYGGRGADPEALFVFYDEAIRTDAPLSLVTLNTVAPTLDELGRAMADYITLISDKVGPLPPPPPRGAGEIEMLLRRVNEQVGFGRLSPADGAKQFVTEAGAVLARG